MKKFNAVIAIFVLISMILCSCGQSNADSIDGKVENVSAENEIGSQSDEFFTDGYTAPEETTVYVDPEYRMETYGWRTYLDPENREESEIEFKVKEITYEGNDIVIYTDFLYFEQENTEMLVYLNGILQDVSVEKDGVYLGKADECDFDISPEVQSTIKMTFRPNIGKKGDVLDLGVIAIHYPKYAKVNAAYAAYWLADKFVDAELRGYNYIDRLSEDVKLIMQADADTQAVVNTSYSRLTITDIDPYIAEFHDRDEEDQIMPIDWRSHDLHGIICTDPKDMLVTMHGTGLVNDKFEAKRSSETQFDIILYGTPGTYRIGLYANGVLLPVFDGMKHTDVTLEYDKQATFTVTLDTTDFDDYTSLRLITYNANPENIFVRYQYPWLCDSTTLILK